MRASAACETAGVPASSIVCEGFVGLAKTTSVGLGLPNLPLAVVPGHVGNQSKEQLRRHMREGTSDAVVANLLEQPADVVDEREPKSHEIIFAGDLDEVNRYFYENEWGDGLPLIPPTIDRIETFLRFTDRAPDECLGVLLPDNRAATVWSVAVNGVMAGCRPEYMPVLVALIEAMADPAYGVEHSGNTPGGETLIILNGPIIKDLNFNYEQGVLRDGFIANTSIGRFWRLYLRNIAGFLPHKNDKATFGNTWRVVLAENESHLAKIGWEPMSADMGFDAGHSTVTIARYTGGNLVASVFGDTPERLMPYLADAMLKQNTWQLAFTVGNAMGTLRPLMLLSPILAQTIAAGGWSKQDVRQYLFDHARLPAWQFERYLGEWTDKPIRSLSEQVRLGTIPALFAESEDPDRMVPLVFKPDDFMIAVSGDLLRNNAYVFAHNGNLGFPVAKAIRLPTDWPTLLTSAGRSA